MLAAHLVITQTHRYMTLIYDHQAGAPTDFQKLDAFEGFDGNQSLDWPENDKSQLLKERLC